MYSLALMFGFFCTWEYDTMPLSVFAPNMCKYIWFEFELEVLCFIYLFTYWLFLNLPLCPICHLPFTNYDTLQFVEQKFLLNFYSFSINTHYIKYCDIKVFKNHVTTWYILACQCHCCAEKHHLTTVVSASWWSDEGPFFHWYMWRMRFSKL